MMRWIIGASLQFRLLVLATAAAIVFFGFRQMSNVQMDLLPEFTRPTVVIQTEALGLSAAEVESLITTPLEADMLSGMPWTDEIRSESIAGLSSIHIIFKTGTNILAARQMVQERLVSVHALPAVSKPPAMLNPVSSANRVLNIGLSSNSLSAVEMSVQARWTIKPRLMGIPGVANVSIWGQRQRQLQVLVDPKKLKEKNVTLHQIISTTGNALWVSHLTYLDASSPGTGGWIETPNQRLNIQHLLPISAPSELAQVTVEGTKMSLGEVARVVETHQPLIGDAIVNDQSNLLLVVEKFPWANTVQVTRDVEKAIKSLSQGLTGLDMDTTLYRPASFIEIAMANLFRTLLIAGGLVILAVFAFFANWRTALISIAAILVSVVTVVLVLNITGTAMNMLLIGGIAIALVAIIDDAIVDVDNIARCVRQHHQAGGDQSIANVILETSLKMRRTLGYATLMLVLAVIPFFFKGGVYGAFFQTIAYPYILAIVVSMVAALCVTTVLSLLLLPRETVGNGDSPLARAIQGMYDAVGRRIVTSPQLALIVICLIFLAGLFVLPRLQRDSLLPTYKETNVAVHLDGLPGTSHPAMARIVGEATRRLRSIPGINANSAHVGRAVMSDEVANINSAEIWISINPDAHYSNTITAIREIVDSYPGLERDVVTHSQDKIDNALEDESDVITVRVYGDNLDIMHDKAKEIADVLEHIEGLVDPEVHLATVEPNLEIQVDLEKAKKYGLKPGDVRRASAALLSGIEVGNLFEAQKVFDVVVWGEPELRHSLSSVRDLLIDTPDGGHVSLGEVADIRLAPAATVIERETIARHVDVTASVRNGNYAELATQIRLALHSVKFPLEYRAELLPGYGDRLANTNRMISVAVAAAIGILLLMQVAFGSWRLAGTVFLTLPVALVGGVLGAYATGSVISLGSLAGFLAMLSIAVRNGMTLVKHFQHLQLNEGVAFGSELVLRGTRERLIPMVMSAVVIALAFVPFAWSGERPGLEILHPMAIVILGGLVTSTSLSLIGVPALYLLYGKKSEQLVSMEADMNVDISVAAVDPAMS